jgi:hypothetical protein
MRLHDKVALIIASSITRVRPQAVNGKPLIPPTLREPGCDAVTQIANFSLTIGGINGMVFFCNEHTKPEITSALDLNDLICRQSADPAILHGSAGMSLRPPTAMSANTLPI